MAQDTRDQAGYDVRFEWGPVGAARADGRGEILVVDVLSFTTSVTVAVERGIRVVPAARHDAAARALADETGAMLAVARGTAAERQPWSLSPAALASAPAPARLVLPSPNGSAIAAAARGRVVAACLRNRSAVAAWLRARLGERGGPVTVVAAGERWPDGSLRPAVEDLLGAGAVLSALGSGAGSESPEARVARAAYEATPSVPDAVRGCASGLELARAGFGRDVEIAVELDASDVVPVLGGGAFRPAGR